MIFRLDILEACNTPLVEAPKIISAAHVRKRAAKARKRVITLPLTGNIPNQCSGAHIFFAPQNLAWVQVGHLLLYELKCARPAEVYLQLEARRRATWLIMGK